MPTQTPTQAAALHRAEINLTVDLNPDKPIHSNQIPSLLSSLSTVHSEATLLKHFDHQTTPTQLDHHHIRRLTHLIRSIQPCANFLQAVTTTTDVSLSAATACTIAAFVHLHVAHTPDLVTALAAFVSLASDHSSEYRSVVFNTASDLVPALHALLEQPVDPPIFHRAALPALPVIIHIAAHFVHMSKNEACSDKRHGMLALAEIAVDVVKIVLQSCPTHLHKLHSQIDLLVQKVDRVLPDVPEVQTLQRDVRNLLQVGTNPST